MTDEAQFNNDAVVIGFQHLEMPLVHKPTAAELELRREAIARIRRLRKEVGKIGISPDDLINESRQDSGH